MSVQTTATTPAPSPRKRTPGRPPARLSSSHTVPARKRRRYIPGGPGGGGRWIDVNAAEPMDFATPIRMARTHSHGHGHGTGADLTFGTAPATDRPVRSRNTRPTPGRPRRDRERERGPGRRAAATPRPRYSNAAAAAAASQASDGYKPREERSWEEFHPDLDLDAALMLFTADQVDGVTKDDARLAMAKQAVTNNSNNINNNNNHTVGDTLNSHQPGQSPVQPAPEQPVQTPKRRPGRPPRRTDAMLTGLGSPPAPKILPMPTHNPKERLNLPKPSYRTVDTFTQYEQDTTVQVNYVDKSMANVGYQEGDRFDLPRHALIRHVEGPYDDDIESALRLESDEKLLPDPQSAHVGNVEYDMDEQDDRWLEAHNLHRKEEGVDPIKPSMFEITMTQIEREYHALEKRIPKPNPRHPQTHRPRSSSAAAVNGEPSGPGDEPDTKCVICDDGDCENANAIIFCDGCDLAVHQDCYGVPFIPEGQWFCRKCKEIGRGTPTCIFCPNVDGAFKQTNTLRWSHLLCAIWIPEVTIANTTFMEPITDVEKVPKSRWSLNCYICNQRMGACIQCGNKACYQAFHVTCARRARLFLKMKSSHAGSIDASVLKAFCDRHVPPDWRREHDVDNAIVEAKRYYRHTMRNRRWADSKTAALALIPPQPDQHVDLSDELGQGDDTIVVSSAKRKRTQSSPPKTGWRLPSGAPVVPAVVFNAVDNSLTRFAIRKRKEFLLEACKYWTLKREARKGAALLKRLQLQLESFSPMEITRRNFQAMGPIGRARLLRRIAFSDILRADIDQLQSVVQLVRQREELKFHDVLSLRDIMNTIYFPIIPLLWPILQKAQKLDEKTEMFKEGFESLEHKLADRYYTSVAEFSSDLTNVLLPVIASLDGVPEKSGIRDINDIHDQLNGAPPGTAQHLALSHEQKESKKVTKRIAKAVKEMLDAVRLKEAELKGIPFEKEMGEWAAFDARLESSLAATHPPLPNSDASKYLTENPTASAVAGASPSPQNSVAATTDVADNTESAMRLLDATGDDIHISKRPRTRSAENKDVPTASTVGTLSIVANAQVKQPPSPPDSTSSVLQHIQAPVEDPWAKGGTPWYLEAFDISGTTVYDERWTGKRAMSEDLSEMDDETLQDLKEQSTGATTAEEDRTTTAKVSAPSTAASTRQRRTTRASLAAEVEQQQQQQQQQQLAEDADEEEEQEDEDEEAEVVVEETEERIAAREKRDKVNAKRRAQRRRNRW
ncbi:hypothetical protein AAFC00_001812 [Neodothiora populina]|uniref:NuA3 HAT complex component NTO1 n=1 Tax=Neodothiora populina TaxID=2781224 RepID=A0ABR3PQF8_9PEZI